MTLNQISVNIILFFVKINQLVISIFEYFKYRRLFLTYFYYIINYNTHLIQKLHIKCKKKNIIHMFDTMFLIIVVLNTGVVLI